MLPVVKERTALGVDVDVGARKLALMSLWEVDSGTRVEEVE